MGEDWRRYADPSEKSVPTPISDHHESDLLIAMLKEEDELRPGAVRVFEAVQQNKIEAFTSAVALLEVLFWASKVKTRRANIREYVRTAARLVSDVVPIGYEDLVVAAEYLQERPVFVLDAMHAAAAGTWPILSSDAIYENSGFAE